MDSIIFFLREVCIGIGGGFLILTLFYSVWFVYKKCKERIKGPERAISEIIKKCRRPKWTR